MNLIAKIIELDVKKISYYTAQLNEKMSYNRKKKSIIQVNLPKIKIDKRVGFCHETYIFTKKTTPKSTLNS